MLDLSAHPKLDKQALLGGCLRLPVDFDFPRLLAEFHGIPAERWGSRGGRVGVHTQAEAVFLRGHAPAEGDLPIEDREVASLLPYTRQLVHEGFQAQPLRCLFAKLKAGGQVPLHIDNGEYFDKTIRIHFPIVTNPQAVMLAGGRAVHMQAGEVWALNNSGVHGVINGHASEARTHMICDFLPSEALMALLARGERDLGQPC